MTDATRKQRERDKRRAAGQVRIEAWVHAHAVDAVRAAIDQAVKEPPHAQAREEMKMSNDLSTLLDTADRIAVTDLHPARLRNVIADLAKMLRATITDLGESRAYGVALVEELKARAEKQDQFVAERDRLKAGLVRVELWVPSDKADAVRDAVARVLAGPTGTPRQSGE